MNETVQLDMTCIKGIFYTIREIPHSTCVPSSELNQTVELYKSLVSLLPGSTGCVDKSESMLPRQAVS